VTVLLSVYMVAWSIFVFECLFYLYTYICVMSFSVLYCLFSAGSGE